MANVEVDLMAGRNSNVVGMDQAFTILYNTRERCQCFSNSIYSVVPILNVLICVFNDAICIWMFLKPNLVQAISVQVAATYVRQLKCGRNPQ